MTVMVMLTVILTSLVPFCQNIKNILVQIFEVVYLKAIFNTLHFHLYQNRKKVRVSLSNHFFLPPPISINHNVNAPSDTHTDNKGNIWVFTWITILTLQKTCKNFSFLFEFFSVLVEQAKMWKWLMSAEGLTSCKVDSRDAQSNLIITDAKISTT